MEPALVMSEFRQLGIDKIIEQARFDLPDGAISL